MNAIEKAQFDIKISGVKPRKIFHFSDTHLSLYDELSDENERQTAISVADNRLVSRLSYANTHGEALPVERQLPAKTHFENLLKESEKGDFLFLTGDLLDFVSRPNNHFLEAQLATFPQPFMAVRGNHECNGVPPLGMDQAIQTVEWDDLILLGIDNGGGTITPEQLSAFEKVSAIGKPVLLLMHTPIKTDFNRQELSRVNDYYILNKTGCPPENNDFVSMILDDHSNVKAVFTGHLHFRSVTPLKNGLWQYGVSQGIAGHLHEYKIGE